ncbi:GIY-YIG nuclease family protein [Chthoniobacter flavus]
MAPALSRGVSIVYILQLRSGKLYVGCSDDAETRFCDHTAGAACQTTKVDPPVAVLFVEIQADYTQARRREVQIKKCSRAKKEALIAGDALRLRILSRSHD